MKVLLRVCLAMAVSSLALPVLAQSPNTAAIVVVVLDQTGAIVAGANVTTTNTATGAIREVISGADGSATISGLSLTGTYAIRVNKSGFSAEGIADLALRAGETATVKVTLVVSGGKTEVVVYGTGQGVRADSQIGRSLESTTIDATPILGRKVTTVPLFNSAFRQGKGTGDLFVNATYFITGAGSRRATTFMLDGASNDEAWGRQTMLATVPIGAVQEMSVLSNAFSAEFGWTAGPAMNIVTKTGTNTLHGEMLFLGRPGGAQARTFATDGFCAPSVPSCVTPGTLDAINPADVPDELGQVSGSIGGSVIKDKTFIFVTADHTRQNRTTFLSPTLPSFVLPPDGSLTYVGHYRQELVNARLDHKLSPAQTLMLRANYDHFLRHQSERRRCRHQCANRGAIGGWTTQLNHTAVVNANLLNEARASYLHGNPVTLWEPQELAATYTRAGSVPFTIGESRSSDISGRQIQIADTLSWSRGAHTLRLGGSLIHHTSGGTGSEPGQAILGTFTFLSSTTAPFEQLTLADVQQYSQPISYGITSYELTQWMSVGFVQDSIRVGDDLTVDAGLRYGRH